MTEVDLERFPRKDVELPSLDDSEGNPLRAWAWKVTIEGEPTEPKALLKGRTVTVKDTVCVAGVPQLFGTDAFTDFVPSMDATAVTRMLEHGAKFVGKAACENFSHGPVSHSSPRGPVENPYARGFSTGGSSSGCGALVGSGAVDLGIGGDQGGSIRIPASLCGLVGLKPTFGLVPYTGVLSSATEVDHIGPMTRTTADAAILLEAIAGDDNIDDRSAGAPARKDIPAYSELLLAAREKPLAGKTIGILTEGFAHKAIDPNVARCVREAAAKYTELGATVKEVTIPLHTLTEALCHVQNKFSSCQTRQGRQVGRRGLYVNEYFDKVCPWTQDKYEKAKYYVTGTAMSGEYGWQAHPLAYGRTINLIRRLRDNYDALLASCDAIVMPTVVQPPRRHAPPEAGPLGWASCTPGIISNTAASNMTGHPSITLPVGFTPPHKDDIKAPEDAEIKLPCGMMLVGRMYDDATLLALADAWERKWDWKTLNFD